MPLKVTKRGKSAYWYIRGTVRGQYVDESTGTTDRKLAEEIRTKTEYKLLQESIHGRRATITFLEAAVGYMENGGERLHLTPIIKHFGTTELSKIRQLEIDNAAKKLYPNCKNSTLNRKLYSPISGILKWAAQRDLYDFKPIKRPSQPLGKIIFLHKNEAEALISACAPHIKPLVIFLLYTGARPGEGVFLDWEHVDLQKRRVRFVETKNGTSRSVPLHTRVVAALANLDKKTGKVFRKPDGTPYEGEKSTCFKTAFKAAVKRAKIKHISPHGLRHTWATWHYQINRNIPELQELGGWKSVEMVFRYAHMNVDHLEGSIDALHGEFQGNFKKNKIKSL